MADAAGVMCSSKRKLLSTAGDGTLTLLYSLLAPTTHYLKTMQNRNNLDNLYTSQTTIFNLLSWVCCQKEVMAASGGNDHATRQLCKLSNKHYILSKQQIKHYLTNDEAICFILAAAKIR